MDSWYQKFDRRLELILRATNQIYTTLWLGYLFKKEEFFPATGIFGPKCFCNCMKCNYFKTGMQLENTTAWKSQV